MPTTNDRPWSILHIEDQALEVRLIRDLLEAAFGRHFHLEHRADLRSGLERLARGGLDIVLLDLTLPDSRGIDTFRRAYTGAKGIPIILLTNIDDEELAALAVREGAQDYLSKRHLETRLLARSMRYAVERNQAEEALRRSEERYALAVRGSNEGIWDWAMGEGTLYFSPRWKAMLGYEEHELDDNPDEWLGRIHPEDHSAFLVDLDEHRAGKTAHLSRELRVRHRDGRYVWMQVRGLGIRDAAGQCVRMAGSMSDISARKRAEQQLLHDALHDALTQLPNRSLLLDRLQVELNQQDRPGALRFAVLFLDLDRFKNVNDSLGHLIGDKVLMETAERLVRLARPGDTVARLGGDEFGIILHDITSPSDPSRVAERILERLRDPILVEGFEISVSASIGIVIGSETYKHPEEMLRDADTAMYRAKSGGKSRYEIFDHGMHQRVLHLLRLESALRRGLERGEFILHYQPIITLNTGRVTAFEALVRWQHPTRGLVSPSEFIPVAEETGLIVPLGWWTLAESCRQAATWAREFPEQTLAISVNVSTKLFKQQDFVSRLGDILTSSGLAPEQLRIELTESLLLDHSEKSIKKLCQLRELGIGLHLDDFGTGYSSLSYLKQFPYDSIKIDRSFVTGVCEANGSGAIVQTVINLGQLLGMNIIAEGVESRRQLDRLRDWHCPQAQGFWFSKPLDSGGIGQLLATAPCWN